MSVVPRLLNKKPTVSKILPHGKQAAVREAIFIKNKCIAFHVNCSTKPDKLSWLNQAKISPLRNQVSFTPLVLMFMPKWISPILVRHQIPSFNLDFFKISEPLKRCASTSRPVFANRQSSLQMNDRLNGSYSKPGNYNSLN